MQGVTTIVPLENSSGTLGLCLGVGGPSRSSVTGLFFFFIAIVGAPWHSSDGRPRRRDHSHEGVLANTVVVWLGPCAIVLGVFAFLQSLKGQEASGGDRDGRILSASAWVSELFGCSVAHAPQAKQKVTPLV